jgi:hypothetical protein
VFPAEGNALRRMICKSEFKSLTGEIVIYIATPKEQLGPRLQGRQPWLAADAVQRHLLNSRERVDAGCTLALNAVRTESALWSLSPVACQSDCPPAFAESTTQEREILLGIVSRRDQPLLC